MEYGLRHGMMVVGDHDLFGFSVIMEYARICNNTLTLLRGSRCDTMRWYGLCSLLHSPRVDRVTDHDTTKRFMI
jgi:hypothetical protein